MPPKAKKYTYIVDLYGDFDIALNVSDEQAQRYADYVGNFNPHTHRRYSDWFHADYHLRMPRPGTITVTGHKTRLSTQGTFEFPNVEVKATSAEDAIDIAKRTLRNYFVQNTCTRPWLTFI